ncbi:unnamed protein product, partial [Prorocentrum cordatum]
PSWLQRPSSFAMAVEACPRSPHRSRPSAAARARGPHSHGGAAVVVWVAGRRQARERGGWACGGVGIWPAGRTGAAVLRVLPPDGRGHPLWAPALRPVPPDAEGADLPDVPQSDAEARAGRLCGPGPRGAPLGFAPLQRAYRLARRGTSAEACQARSAIANAFAARLREGGLGSLAAALPAAPLDEPVVQSALDDLVAGLEQRVSSFASLLRLAAQAPSMKRAAPCLCHSLSRVIMSAVQRLVPALTPEQLQANAGDLARLRFELGVDGEVLSFHLQEALLTCLAEEFSTRVARRFICATAALVKHGLLVETVESYVAQVFAARAACFITSATMRDLDVFEEEILPRMPMTPLWDDARDTLNRSVSRQVDLCVRVREFSSSVCKQPSKAEQVRLVHIRQLVRGMQQLDRDALGPGPGCAASPAVGLPPTTPQRQRSWHRQALPRSGSCQSTPDRSRPASRAGGDWSRPASRAGDWSRPASRAGLAKAGADWSRQASRAGLAGAAGAERSRPALHAGLASAGAADWGFAVAEAADWGRPASREKTASMRGRSAADPGALPEAVLVGGGWACRPTLPQQRRRQRSRPASRA